MHVSVKITIIITSLTSHIHTGPLEEAQIPYESKTTLVPIPLFFTSQ